MEPMTKHTSHTGRIVISIVIIAILLAVVAFSKPSTKDKAMMAEKEAMEQKAMMEKDAMIKEEAMKEDAMIKNGDAMMKKDTNMAEKEAMMVKGSYEIYAPEKLAWVKDGNVVLFFKASWCPSCRAVDADIKAHLSNIPTGTHILEVDYDTALDLKKKYGVTYQHTFVQVDQNGGQIAKWSGSPTLASLLTNIK